MRDKRMFLALLYQYNIKDSDIIYCANKQDITFSQAVGFLAELFENIELGLNN